MRSFFFLAICFILCAAALSADLTVGQIYGLNFVDVDGHTLSTTDGHVTVIVLTTQSDIDKARTVGDRVPEYCLGDPNYRMITVVNFQKKHSKPIRMILSALVRRRLDAEAQRLQPRYTAKKIIHDPRRDVFAVADFDGSVVAGLGARFEASDFRVFVFGRNGELLQQWNDVPTAAQLAAVVK
ncbi:MAG TPA: hypothetical protein VN904_06060 [Chthoniobacterales bacterium]|nr:hypothetical protein [Chthoniobacterales bacterium]